MAEPQVRPGDVAEMCPVHNQWITLGISGCHPCVVDALAAEAELGEAMAASRGEL